MTRWRGFARLIAASLVLVAASPAPSRGETIGVVIMHGKQGLPGQLQRLAGSLDEAGFLTERPEMCWSRERIYDRTYLDCLADADAAADRLKARGADTIVILGMSLGGNAALGYGARRDKLRGVIALAPAHAVEFLRLRSDIAASVRKAEAMIAGGQADDRATFNDTNNGHDFEVTTTAAIYLSFFGPASPAVMPDNAARLTAPLLIVSGTDDATQRPIPAVFARAPSDPRNQMITVNTDHLGTPNAAAAMVVQWLKMLTR